MGRGSGKDGRPLVIDLIKAREVEADLRASEAALRKELAEERKRFEDFRREESLRTMQIVHERELELSQHVANLRATPNQTPITSPYPGQKEKLLT